MVITTVHLRDMTLDHLPTRHAHRTDTALEAHLTVPDQILVHTKAVHRLRVVLRQDRMTTVADHRLRTLVTDRHHIVAEALDQVVDLLIAEEAAVADLLRVEEVAAEAVVVADNSKKRNTNRELLFLTLNRYAKQLSI